MLHPVPTRAAAASEFPRPDDNHATQLRQGSLCALPHRQRLAQPSPTRNPLDCAAGSFCPSASPHLAGSALPAVLLGHQLPFTENRCGSSPTLDNIPIC